MFTNLPFEMNLQYFSKIGFVSGEEPIKDALKDDQLMQQILEASSAIALLSIKRNLANTPLTEVDRQIYYEAIHAKCRSEFGYYDVEEAAQIEKVNSKPNLGFAVESEKMTIVTDASEPVMGAVTDSAGEAVDVCVSKAVAIVDQAGKTSGWYKQIVAKVDAINGNMRLYPRGTYEHALKKLKSAGFPYAGEHPHPRSYLTAQGKTMFDSKIPNQCVKFRDAYIDDSGYVWAEYKTIDTDMGRQVQTMIDEGLPIGFSNRMTGVMVPINLHGKTVKVPKSLDIKTWDVLLNPAESESYHSPIALTDSAICEILDSLKEEEPLNFFTMTLSALKDWKKQNPGHADMAVCDAAIEAKEKEQALTDELEKLRLEKQTREQQEEANRKKKEAQKALVDAVNELSYDKQVKDGLLQKGAAITDASEVASFIDTEKAFVDAIQIDRQKQSLGISSGRAAIVNQEVQVGAEGQPWKPIMDNLMAAFDDRLRSTERNFHVDTEMRKANTEILDRVMAKMERDNHEQYRRHMQDLTDSAQSIENGAITDSAMSSTGDFAQAALISRAFMYQVWQDLKFAQLAMAEPFSGSTYKIPVEFQGHDLYTQDDFVTGEYEGIVTEGVETFFLEFAAEWFKRGTLLSKEALTELQSGPMNYDSLARNLANLAARFQRVKDQKLGLEMIHVSDEYNAKTVTDEKVEVAEFTKASGNVPSGSNVAFIATMLCGNPSGTVTKQVPPIVRPRTKVWLDQFGRKQSAIVNDIVVKVGSTVLQRGTWDPIKKLINNGDYAIDFENAKAYFTESSRVSESKLPTLTYAYATNVSFFDLTVPTSYNGRSSLYYNKLLEQLDYEKAYMGSAPRYVTPDFALGSLNAMVNLKNAELFYKWASPEGTNLLKGKMWFADRNGLDIGEMNTPWAAGDQRILLGKVNATRLGIGSPMAIEGPEAYYDPKTTRITSARQYFATEQVAIATPLVIDDAGNTYNPPYRTIKLFNS
ncbi:hypothetical protein [Brevibacillus laterosporus]|uniref:hypothetical protein n=1 Tax=Brevibacillus laterosporus TaxID=1465 RepID=UPI00264D068E|nr:hypothetical protein [Brevibacillus laterosporus]MDN9011104.1 hypothetical protein [Brevibacillus laterosporus]MDO0942127.1 hypothetical protein [Brevibacillus laterosporus]